MTESFEQYRKRVLGYLGDRDPIRVQRSTPSRVERLVSGLSRRQLNQRPGPDRWSVAEIVAHMADAELAMGWRLRNMLATSGVRLQWFDEAAWAERFEYASMDVGRSLGLFRCLRQRNLDLLHSVGRREWRSCYGVHELRGRQTVWDFVRMEAAHDLAHIRQIKGVLRNLAM
ncbi:MAG: DinB family protein [Gemmatimonadota bacterium]|nr:MAG: DinB family protein [Gemmatimonadota bacterium]